VLAQPVGQLGEFDPAGVDGDAVQGEPVVGAPPEPGAALGPLVAQDRDIGQAGVVVDRGVQVVIAAA
jgi:hypothetical protein